MDDKQVATLKALLVKAKKEPLNFGLSMAKDPEDTVMILHRIMDGKKLGFKANDILPDGKMVYGKVSVDGRLVKLNCVKKPPASLMLNVKKFLSSIGLSQPVEVTQGGGAGGNPADSKKWDKLSAALEPLLTASMSRLPEASSLRAGWATALAAAQGDEYDDALKAGQKVEANFNTAIAAFGQAQLAAGMAQFDKVKSTFTDQERKDIRILAGGIEKAIEKRNAVEIEKARKAFDSGLAKITKEVSAGAAVEQQKLKGDLAKIEKAISTLENSTASAKKNLADAEGRRDELIKLMRSPQQPKKAVAEKRKDQLQALGDMIVKQQAELEKKTKEVATQVAALKKEHGGAVDQIARRLSVLETGITQLKKAEPAKTFKAAHAALEKTIKEMDEANKWREAQMARGDGSHGSSRHGAPTGIDRQARRAATGGATPDNDTRKTGTTAHITKWKGATIEWEEVGGKRKIKSRTPVQKQILDEVIKMGVTDTASVFATPVLEKLAVDTAIKKVTDAGWNEIYSNAKDWHDFTEVTVVLGKPRGKAGWGYAVTRKEAATMALAEANKVLKKFEEGKISEKQLLKDMGVEYLLKDGAVQMIPNAKVILKRNNGSGTWQSLTHYPHPVSGGGEAAASWDIENRRVRKKGGAEARAQF